MITLARSACLTNYEEVARHAGLDPIRMLRSAGLPRECLRQPDLKISVQAVRRLLVLSAELSEQEAFGLMMAEGRRISNLGVLGMLLREEPTLRCALQSLHGYGRMQNEALLQRIEEAQGIATIYEDLLLGGEGACRQSIELLVAIALKIMRFFLGSEWRPLRICFTHAAPVDASVHRRVLGQLPEFGCDFNGIVCKSEDLDTPIASADPVVAGYIRQKIRDLSQSSMTVTDEVQQMVLMLLPHGRCTVEQVAHAMGITRRTLHRYLSHEGEVFCNLVQALRRDLAVRYVSERQRSLTDISQLLGFSNLSSFTRWHKAHFGCSAGELRKRMPRVRRSVAAEMARPPALGDHADRRDLSSLPLSEVFA